MQLILKSLIGAGVVIVMTLLSKTKNDYLVVLVPLFPTFAIISYYMIGTQKEVVEFKMTIIFGIFGLIPYFIFLISLYFLSNYTKIIPTILGSIFFWTISVSILIMIWKKIQI